MKDKSKEIRECGTKDNEKARLSLTTLQRKYSSVVQFSKLVLAINVKSKMRLYLNFLQ